MEIRSPTDRCQDADSKVGEYLDAGGLCVLVVDPAARQVQVFAADQPVQLWNASDIMRLSIGLPGFAFPVEKLFD